MGKSIKLGSDTYLDWSGVTVNSSGRTLADHFTNLIAAQHCVNEASATIASGGVTSRIINIDKTGYTPIGIIGYGGSGTAEISFSDVYIDTIHTAKAYYANNTSISKTVSNLFVDVIYIKNT